MKKKVCILVNVLVMALTTMCIIPVNGIVVVDSEDDELIQEQFIDDDYKVSFEIIETWENYYDAKITIKNISDKDIENWEMSFKTPNQITNIWCAKVINHVGDTYVVKNLGWNQDIKVKGSISFGFTASYDKEISEPHDCLGWIK